MDQPNVNPGIRGWLILPLLGLFLSPFRISFFLYQEMWPIFSQGYWAILTTPTNETYHPYWAPLLVFEIVGNLLLIVATLAALYFFLTKSRYTPQIMIAWLAFILAFNVLDFFLADLIPAVAAQDDFESAKELARACIAAVIWIPYFLISKRVKATFVN